MPLLEKLGRVVEANRDRTFLIAADGGRELAYGEAHGRARTIAAALRARGLQRGDRVAVSATNSVELALLYLALAYGGQVAVPVGAGFGRRERRSILRRTRPRLIVSDQAEQLEALAGLSEQPPELARLAAAGAEGDLDPWAGEPGDFEPFGGMSATDVVSIHFTSGTTGTPRGVAHRLSGFFGNAERVAEAMGLDASNRFHSTLPMTYMAGYYNLLLLPFSLGASVVIDRAFDASSLLRFWEAPVRHGVDVLWFVPTVLAMLLKADRDPRGPEHCREHVRLALCGTAPLDADLRERFEKVYGVAVHDSYGLSETLLVAGSTPARPAAPGIVGSLLPGVRVEVRDAGGELPRGEAGNLLIDSPDLMAGYLRESDDEPEFSLPLVDGLFDTGDIGRVSDDDQLQITGRAKEIIIRGGVNVSAVEVERALEEHDAVEHAAVVGVPHELLGEEIAAVLVCRDEASLETIEAQLQEQLQGKLERAQQPGLYLQIDAFPLTPTGKVRKAAVRDLVIDRLGLPTSGKGFALETGRDGSQPAPAPPGGRIIDLSHPLHEGMVSFPSPNHPRPEVIVLARHDTEGRATRRLVLGTHTGTHMDAPLHFIPDGMTIDQVPLDVLVGPAQVADMTPVEPLAEVSLERLKQALGGAVAHPRVLLRFDWSRRFTSLAFYEESPFLSLEACRWLVEQGVRVLGMDTPSPDDPRKGFGSGDDSPNHHELLGAGVVLIEYLAGLDQLERPETYLAALPLPVSGADGSPARVVAIEPA